MFLTELAIKTAKPQAKEYKMPDSRGFHLLVKPNGAKLWRERFKFEGREVLMSHGPYPTVTLKMARDKHLAARRLLSEGINPVAVRKSTRNARGITFKLVAEEWLERQSRSRAAITIAVAQARLESTLFPSIGNRPISAIEATDLLPVLQRVESSGRVETAHRLSSLYSRIARYAIQTGRAKRDVSLDLRGALGAVKVTHHAAIVEPRAIGALLRAIDSYDGFAPTAFALRLLPYLFPRSSELRGALWREFDLDSREPTWRIPPERMKMGREHVIPLATQPVRILRDLKALTGSGRFCFPGLRPDKPISNNTLGAALASLGYASTQMTPHGFRTMASTCLNEAGINSDLIEKQLAHVEQDAVRAAYDRSSLVPQRRKMMQQWADMLDAMRTAKDEKPRKARRVARDAHAATPE